MQYTDDVAWSCTLETYIILLITATPINLIFFQRFYLFIFRERGRERDISQLPFTRPQLGTQPTTQACAQTGN